MAFPRRLHRHPGALALLGALVVLGDGASAQDLSEGFMAGPVPDHHVADPDAPVVTEANVLESETFWPYQVAMVEAWSPGGGRPAIGPGVQGVLIRVEDSGAARIDFGRDGIHDVPLAATDLLARANRIRLGEQEKTAPNFVLAIGPRLLDGSSVVPRPFGLARTSEYRGFLCVFADPSAEEFPAIAEALAPLRERTRVLTILLPQGRHPDTDVSDRLHELGWPVPYVLDHLSEGYTRSLIDETPPPPMLLLQDREGRVLFRSSWKEGVVPELRSAVDRAFGGTVTVESERSTGTGP